MTKSLTAKELRKIKLRILGKSDRFLYCKFCDKWKISKRNLDLAYEVLESHIRSEHPEEAKELTTDLVNQLREQADIENGDFPLTNDFLDD